jgi:hypothetical protein
MTEEQFERFDGSIVSDQLREALASDVRLAMMEEWHNSDILNNMTRLIREEVRKAYDELRTHRLKDLEPGEKFEAEGQVYMICRSQFESESHSYMSSTPNDSIVQCAVLTGDGYPTGELINFGKDTTVLLK